MRVPIDGHKVGILGIEELTVDLGDLLNCVIEQVGPNSVLVD